ncbi:MAG: ABC transporter permease, partial [Gorillibacterium sp.]|nr:ABC transporter permease [Gorillibacterium sp.]
MPRSAKSCKIQIRPPLITLSGKELIKVKRKSLWKDIFREIWRTKARFLSILAIICLGIGFFAGIKATGPDMLDTADYYFKTHQLMDLKVQSNYGLTLENIAALQNAPDVLEVQPGYTADTFLTESGLIAKVFSYNKAYQLNQYQIAAGRLPERSGEIAIDDNRNMSKAYQVGDTITFSNTDAAVDLADSFKTISYKVVGVVKSPQFIESLTRSSSSIGKGTSDAFVVIAEEDFNLPVYTEAYLSFKDTAEEQAYTETYDALVEKHKKAVEQIVHNQPAEQLAVIKAEGQAKLDEAQRKITAVKQKLTDAAAALAVAKAKLDEGSQNNQDGPTSNPQRVQGQADYEVGLATYEAEKQKADQEIAKAEQEIAEGQKKLAELALPKSYVLDRSSNSGYIEFSDNADRLASIATAFPVFFFLIAALVSLTTMTRMVEEQRQQIGTLKALGYSNGEIMLKFLVYGTLASIIAAIVGLAIGFTLFPTIIYNAYGALYNLPSVRTSFYLSYSAISVAVALLCTSMTAIIATRVELRSNASILMRPKSPRSGQRILLERIAFLWKRLSFVQKVTARNLFRYKQRMFMTVIGVAGCTALILTGFGLKDSIGDIAGIQFSEIMKYQAVVAFHEDSPEQLKASYDELIAATPQITGSLKVTQDIMIATKKGVNNQDVVLFVPETTAGMDRFVVLKDRKTDVKQQLTDQGAIVTEKLAKLYNLHAGSTLTVKNNKNESFQIKVAG